MCSFCRRRFISLVFLLLAATSRRVVNGAASDFISCSDPCNGGDVNYDLIASVRTMSMMNYTYRGRTYSNQSSDSFMGPTMRVSPGQSLWIKLWNRLLPAAAQDDDDEDDTTDNNNKSNNIIGPDPPGAVEYWKMLQNPGEKIKYQRYGRRVPDPSRMTVDESNMPHDFDSTNLHLHGLDVDVHMFDPVGTHDPAAPHIAVRPGECYCYRFTVPDHHPTGMYWYHPHLHGSTAIQMWSGMFGVLYVEGGKGTTSTLQNELERYGVTRSEEFIIWDPAFREVEAPSDGAYRNLEVDDFLSGQTTLSKIHPFLVNGKITPDFRVAAGQFLHFRVLCATVENEVTFIVYPAGMEGQHWNDRAVPFWVLASDGVTYRRPKERIIMVLSGGQREEVLLRFPEPGTYVISQQGIQGMQFFDMMGHPHDQIIATITVVEDDHDDNDNDSNDAVVPISDMVFTPGYQEEENILAEDIVGSETIVFSMGANFDQAPFPQYYVNGRAFDPDEINFHAQPGEAREYVLMNANHNAHPFHIHVNRFQIKEMGSELSAETYPVLESVLDYDPHVWRDTVMIPPNGRTRIWVQYKNYTGKTVLHCHFLAHEDTGMMATLFIGPKDRVFRWKDHVDWIAGCFVGALSSVASLVACFVLRRQSRATKPMYSAVSMNEIKSKVMD